MTHDPVLETMHQIQQYLDARPQSADTLEGIHCSWIDSQEPLDITRAALERLLDAGIVERLQYGRNTVLWRRARKNPA